MLAAIRSAGVAKWRIYRDGLDLFHSGRGAAAQVVLGSRAYQVNVIVGDSASPTVIADALAVARSFDLARS